MRRSVHVCSAFVGALATAAMGVAACVGDEPAAAPPDAATADSPQSLEDQAAPVDSAQPPPDGGGGATDASDAPLRKCQTVVPPPAPNDFFCADFDGLNLAEGWTHVNDPDAGTLSLTQTVYSSSPNALNSLGIISDAFAPRGSTLDWEKLGATTIREVDLKVELNPVAPGGVIQQTAGDIELVTIQIGGTGNATVTYSLRQTRGKNVTGSGPYTGLYLFSSLVGGAAVATTDLITTSPTPGSFTIVRMLAASSGSVTISYNGVQIFTKALYAFTESRAVLTIGALTSGPTVVSETFRFDNVIAQINRN